MLFKPCFVIPIFDHKDTIARTVEKLSAFNLAIFIVDDGSGTETKTVLATLAQQYPLVHLLRLPINSGKGAAVMHGMVHAYHAGFTHALQIDADGQHTIEDVPQFLAQGMANPTNVICGKPIYDNTVPKGRLYGRYITHFWVWVETLSFNIQDSMCGFRLYPLATTCKLIDEVTLPKRMDFDTEIVVRLAWRGVQFVNIPTRVIYPENGISHFNMLHDNIRITKMHTRLCCGMLLRLPVLLWRKLIGSHANTTHQHWSKLSERGTHLGLKMLASAYHFLGKKVTSLLLYPVVTYFFITDKKSRMASKDFLERVYLQGAIAKPTWRASFQHMLAFAQSALDKFSAWTGGMPRDAIDFPNQDALTQILQSGRGALIIGSHLGNLEMSRALAIDHPNTIINAVVYTEHAQRFNQMLMQANARFNVNLIQVSDFGVDTAILFQEKIHRGELIVIVGDRTPPAENGRVSHVNFLGDIAPFAQGPMILASLLSCPVYLLFCLPVHHQYRIYLEHFADKIQLPRSTRESALQTHIQQYAARLESYCLTTPLQWFNFYDFWQKTTPSQSK